MKYDFKGPKEYLNLVHKNGQSYEITPFFDGFCLMFTSIFGSGKSSGSLRIRIHNTGLISVLQFQIQIVALYQYYRYNS
jgi:hypothetical protein